MKDVAVDKLEQLEKQLNDLYDQLDEFTDDDRRSNGDGVFDNSFNKAIPPEFQDVYRDIEDFYREHGHDSTVDLIDSL